MGPSRHSEYASSTLERDATILDYVAVVRSRFPAIAVGCVLAMAGAFGISLLMPKMYESTASLLPQIESKEGSGLGALLAAGGGSAAQTLGIVVPGLPTSSTDIFTAMLKSRVMADDVIREFHLLALYETDMMQDARDRLDGDTRITLNKEKVIKITVEARDPKLAANMANFYVSNLDRLNRTLNVTKAGEHRKFIERRLAETQASLVKAEEVLKEFQTQNKTVAIEAQAKAMIEAAASIQGQITAQEVQLQVMGAYLSEDNPELARVRSGIEELRKQLSMMELGKGGKGMFPGHRMHPAIVAVPGLALDYGRLIRELRVQETVYGMLMTQYEQAKLAEARDGPTVQLLDPAVPAERKSRPKILLNMIVAGAAVLMLGIIWAFMREAVEKRKTQSNAHPLAA